MNFISYRGGADYSPLLWHDPWLVHKPLIPYFDDSIVSTLESTSMATVGSIILNGTWYVRSNHHSAFELRQLLSSFTISLRDAFLWNGQQNVNQSFIWSSIRRSAVPPPWCPAIWHRLMIQNCSYFMWLALRNRLLTKDRMLYFRIHVDPSCVLCRCNVETSEHIFFDCPYTSILKHSSPVDLTLSLQDWLAGIFFIGSLSNLKKEAGYLYISVMIYLLWKERNNRMHQNGNINPSDII